MQPLVAFLCHTWLKYLKAVYLQVLDRKLDKSRLSKMLPRACNCHSFFQLQSLYIMSLVLHLKSSLIQVSSSRCTKLINNNKLSLYISKHTAALPLNFRCGNKPQNTKLRLLAPFEEKINLYRTFTFTINWFSVWVRHCFCSVCVRSSLQQQDCVHLKHIFLHLDSILAFWYFPHHLCSLNLKAQTASCKLGKFLVNLVCRSCSFYPKWL